jgi:DNA-directed RNA polymerase I, II, and III subunit RPABC5
MLIPVRCFSCGKVIGGMWEPYQKYLSEGKTIPECYRLLGLTRYCCQRMLMTHVPIIDTLLKYKQLPEILEIDE